MFFSALLLEFVDTYSSFILFFLGLAGLNTFKNLALYLYSRSANFTKVGTGKIFSFKAFWATLLSFFKER